MGNSNTRKVQNNSEKYCYSFMNFVKIIPKYSHNHHHSNKKKGGTNSIVPHCNCNEHPKMATLFEFLIMSSEKILHEIALHK